MSIAMFREENLSMTVKELREKLEEFPDDYRVVDSFELDIYNVLEVDKEHYEQEPEKVVKLL